MGVKLVDLEIIWVDFLVLTFDFKNIQIPCTIFEYPYKEFLTLFGYIWCSKKVQGRGWD